LHPPAPGELRVVLPGAFVIPAEAQKPSGLGRPRSLLSFSGCSLSFFAATTLISTMKLQMDEILRFWTEVACENIQFSGGNLTKRQLLTQILRQYEQRGDAMRYLNENGKIAWKASQRFLMTLADAERDARDDLADFP
jgi:hypothetical protein